MLNKGDMQNVQSRGSPGLELRNTDVEYNPYNKEIADSVDKQNASYMS